MTEIDRLRSRLSKFAAKLENEFPKQMLARALVATACDVSLADVGLRATVGMTERAINLLAGHWSPDSIKTFIETKH